ncbi:hypothetical protein C0Q70_08046 [Pomacea canaliculata]|uniref:Uncharacterized protein n=1 Tax=Pomacea canaliculata TaxID=400727 RepID=A0A2T7PGQ6_POMCA|nr:hypothetical protein C0Q70_08046 [Pomacea canaliculata]
MPKKKVKNRNKKIQEVNISEVKRLDISVMTITGIDKSEQVTNDLLVALTTNILDQSDLPEQPMSFLEQLVCEKLRETEEGASPLSACVTQEASHIATEVQSASCRLESLQSERVQFDEDVDDEEQENDTRDVQESRTLMDTTKVTFHGESGQMVENDDAVVEHLLNQKEDDLHIFKRSREDYTRNRVQFTIDIVSLWNTPHRQRAYIVLGVKPRIPTPHALIGLRSSTNPEVYYNLVLNDLFNFKPKFTYREVSCRKKLVGILEICSNHGEGSPSIVNNDDCKPHLCTNQLWIRRQGTSIVLPPTDPMYRQVHLWFGQHKSSTANADYITELVEVNTSNSKSAIHPQRKKLEDLSIDKTLAASPEDLTANCAGSDIERLMTSLKNFRKGHFVLVCGSMNIPIKTSMLCPLFPG